MWRTRFVLALLALVLAASCVSARPTAAHDAGTLAITARLDAYVRDLATNDAFSGAVLVAHHGSILLEKGYGWADVAGRVRNTASTEFRIASITKQFTATAILLLQAQGKLHVQDRLCRYIPACPRAWRPITLHELLTHTSGIPDFNFLSGAQALLGTPVTPTQLIARFKHLPLDFVPGTKWSYSSSNFVLLGYIIATVSGTSYAAFLQQHLLRPLHLLHTGYDQNHPHLPQHAIGYTSFGIPELYIDMSEQYAAASLYSMVDDLYRWDQALMFGPFPPRQVVAPMFTSYVPSCTQQCDPLSSVGYGYGLFIGVRFGQRVIYHTGQLFGFVSLNLFYPKSQLVVIVLSNLGTADAQGIAFTLDAMVQGKQ